MAASKRQALRLCRGERGPIRVGYVFSAAMCGVLNRLLRHLRAGLPDIDIEVDLMETPEQLAALDAGKLDVGLVRPRPSYPRDCRATKVHAEPLVLCVAKDNPLAELTRITPSMLAERQFIVPQFHEKVGLIDNLDSLAKVGGFAISDPIRTKDFVTAMCLVAVGEGVVLAPASLANLGVRDVQFRSIEGFDPLIDITLLYRSDTPARAHEILSGLDQSSLQGPSPSGPVVLPGKAGRDDAGRTMQGQNL